MSGGDRGGDGLVYSSERGRMCPKCGWPVQNCACSKENSAPVGDGVVRVGRETKGRKGKGVTVVSGIPLVATDLAAFAKELKKRCGAGGTVRDGVVEVQGDHRDVVTAEIEGRGWKVKRAGG